MLFFIIRKMLKSKTASPLVEEGLLLGLALLTFAIILTIVIDVLGWSSDIFADLMKELGNIG